MFIIKTGKTLEIKIKEPFFAIDDLHHTKEMTIAEIEKKLGYKVKIVKDEEE